MAFNLAPLRTQLGAGASTSICARLAALRVTTPAAAIQVHGIKSKKTKKQRRAAQKAFPPGHGERIFIMSHMNAGMTVYGFKPSIPTTRALKQIPFNGKKLKPAKLRKDYWRTLAMIEFGQGQELVGQSVFQRLVECKRLHETDWSDDLFFEPANGRQLTRHERGERLNDQKANTIADMAAVLGGLGKGNRMVLPSEWTEAPEAGAEGEEAAAAAAPVAAAPAVQLAPATVWWADELDRNFATSWTDNIEHRLIEERHREVLVSVPEEGAPEEQAAASEPTETTA